MKYQAKIKTIECMPTEDFNDYQKVIDFIGDKLVSYNIIYKKNELVDVDIRFEGSYVNGFVEWGEGNLLLKKPDGSILARTKEFVEDLYDIIEE